MKLIGEGRSAEIFDNGDKVIKVFREHYPKDNVDYELKCHEIALKNGAMVPNVYGLIHQENRKGIVYEKIVGSTLKSLFEENFWKYRKTYKEFADALISIHDIEVDELHARDYSKAVLNIDQLSKDVKGRIADRVKDYEVGNRLIHGDYHPDNVMVSDTFYVIDWEGARKGHPCEDIARTLLMFDSPYGMQGIPWFVKPIIVRMIQSYKKNFLKYYLEKTGYKKEDVDKWMLPVASLRLRERIPLEEEWLLTMITRLLEE